MFIYLTLILITLPSPSVGQNVYAGICKNESLYTHTNATCTGNPTCTDTVLTYMHTNATCTSQQGCVYDSGVYFNGIPYASCDDLGKYAFLITRSLYFFYNYGFLISFFSFPKFNSIFVCVLFVFNCYILLFQHSHKQLKTSCQQMRQCLNHVVEWLKMIILQYQYHLLIVTMILMLYYENKSLQSVVDLFRKTTIGSAYLHLICFPMMYFTFFHVL